MINNTEFKCGYVAIVGLPNSGKSTLLNRFLGQKLSIVNSKPQTTRKNILGILSEENYQIIFLDTPGMLNPGYLMQEKMMQHFHSAISDADIIIVLFDIEDDPEGEKLLSTSSFELVKKVGTNNKYFLFSKIDLQTKSNIEVLKNKIDAMKIFDYVAGISAVSGENIDELLSKIVTALPVHPPYYPIDILSSENERFFVSEIIREKILELYREEIPYSCEVVIESYTEKEGRKDYIKAVIFVEKDSQKGILIGAKGEAMKKLGASTRRDVELFLGREVFLELYVKVKKNWRSDEDALKQFGYSN